ncbi:MAG TPA: hypothetical protein VLB80_02090 [Candidatus Babeliales bacterium]|nr:hypothetical protein [Candidatus Babeliales bacterium]
MQKKLLLFFMVIYCNAILGDESNDNNPKIHNQENESKEQEIKDKFIQLVDESFGHPKDILAAYEEELPRDYKNALIKDVSAEQNAIEDLFTSNKIKNDIDAIKQRQCFDDTLVGTGGILGGAGTPPTEKSVNGQIQARWNKLKDDKNKVNTETSDKFNAYKNTFATKIINVLEKKLHDRAYVMESMYLESLKICGLDPDCLISKGINLQDIKNKNFFPKIYSNMFDEIKKIVDEEGLPITKEELINVSALHNATKKYVVAYNIANTKIHNKLNGIVDIDDSEEDKNE